MSDHPEFAIRPATEADRLDLARMRHALWPDAPLEEHLREIDTAISSRMYGTMPMATLVSTDAAGALTGFLEISLRSHADGCDIAQPVGYIEGWFVRERFRHRGVGRALVQAAETWARAQGCREIASDALSSNRRSQHAHEALGFEAVDRCVHYRKPL